MRKKRIIIIVVIILIAAAPSVLYLYPIRGPIKIIIEHYPRSMEVEEECSIDITLKATQKIGNLNVVVKEPKGDGLIASPLHERIDFINPGETKRLKVAVKAQRPSSVNLGKAWELEIVFKNRQVTEVRSIEIDVSDPKKGKIYCWITSDGCLTP